jgi:hypothetical protein
LNNFKGHGETQGGRKVEEKKTNGKSGEWRDEFMG